MIVSSLHEHVCIVLFCILQLCTFDHSNQLGGCKYWSIRIRVPATVSKMYTQKKNRSRTIDNKCHSIITFSSSSWFCMYDESPWTVLEIASRCLFKSVKFGITISGMTVSRTLPSRTVSLKASPFSVVFLYFAVQTCGREWDT